MEADTNERKKKGIEAKDKKFKRKDPMHIRETKRHERRHLKHSSWRLTRATKLLIYFFFKLNGVHAQLLARQTCVVLPLQRGDPGLRKGVG